MLDVNANELFRPSEEKTSEVDISVSSLEALSSEAPAWSNQELGVLESYIVKHIEDFSKTLHAPLGGEHHALIAPENPWVDVAFSRIGSTTTIDESVVMPWKTLKKVLTTHVEGTKEGVCIFPAKVPSGARKGAPFEALSFAMLDIDTKDMDDRATPISMVERMLVRKGLDAFGFTTHSHAEYLDKGIDEAGKTKGERYRIGIRTDRPILPLEAKEVLKAIAGRLGLANYLDYQCLSVNRLFYLPRHAEGRPHYTFITEGKALCIDNLLDEVHAVEAKKDDDGVREDRLKAAQESNKTATKEESKAALVRQRFNEAHSCAELMNACAAYTAVDNDRWIWNESSSGAPGVTLMPAEGAKHPVEKVYSHHSGDPLGEFGRDAFGLYCLIEHGNNFKDALYAAADMYGINLTDEANAPKPIPNAKDLVISYSEVTSSVLTPTCIVDNYLYADLATLIAPGGVGKTTTILYESICIALGRPVWGLETKTPGKVLIVTAEDERERLVARIWALCQACDLTTAEEQTVFQNVLIWDVSGEGRKLVKFKDGNIVLSSLADGIIEAWKDEPPVMIVFDPLVSFGASEQAVNDNEQALIMAGRRIIKALNCCVRYVHHTGKANARDKTQDQYSGRGGSALPDGSRMTTVMQTWTPDVKQKPPEDFQFLSAHESLTMLSRAKLSYSPPNLPTIWVKRSGYRYDYRLDAAVSSEEKFENSKKLVLALLKKELNAGRDHTASSLRELHKELQLTKKDCEKIIKELQIEGRLVLCELPQEKKQGGRTHALRVKLEQSVYA